MKKITFGQFEKMMAYDVIKNNACIEVHFFVDKSFEYASCWLGKIVDKEANQAVYWYGLTPDGSQAYDFNAFHDFVNTPVFHDKNIMEIWESITINSIDSCDVEERMLHFLGAERGPSR